MNVIIIGATSGIGKALYEKYATGGNRVGIAGRREHLLEALRLQHPACTLTATVDVTLCDDALSNLCKRLGHVDLAIVCSGMGELNPSLDYALERPALYTNVVGWTFAVDTLYRLFMQQGHGHLVAITSAGGLRGEPMAPAYSATKAFQINYMEALRKRAFKNGGRITVTDVRPGLTDTAMAKGENLFWVMPIETVARQIFASIGKRKSKVYVTKRWHVLAVVYRSLPFALFKRL